MNARQELFGRTGGCQAAAVFSRDGRRLPLGEDVGRHYAVDESVGEIREQGNHSEASFLCVSERVSLETGSEAARAGLSVLAALSAPSSLAMEYCRDAGAALPGFCRGQRATASFHAERSIFSPALELKHV
jgi:FdhD protein